MLLLENSQTEGTSPKLPNIHTNIHTLQKIKLKKIKKLLT